MTPQFWSAQSYRLLFHYTRSQTSVDVFADGMQVAQLTKNGPAGSAQPFHLTVAGTQAGIIGGPIAYDQNGNQIGSVHSRGLGRRQWSTEQPGVGTLTAKPVGASGLRYRWPQSMLLANGPANAVLPFTFHFRSSTSPGFTIKRKPGVKAEFETQIHDQRLDRRLILTATLSLAQTESNDIRAEITDIPGNPFRP